MRPTLAKGVIGTTVLTASVLFALIGSLLAHSSPGVPYARPTWSHPLGLDDIGQDVLAQLANGARTSLLVGIAAAAVAISIGTIVGTVAGYFGQLIDAVLTPVTDYVLIIPGIPVTMVVLTVFGRSLWLLIVVIAFLSWPRTARVLRSQTKTLRKRAFVERSVSVGSSPFWVIRKHVLPHLAPLIVASTVIMVGEAIFLEAALSFLGLGDPTRTSWGSMLEEAFQRGAASAGAWWVIAAPGLAITVIIFACNLVGQAVTESISQRGSRAVGVSRVVVGGPPARATWSD